MVAVNEADCAANYYVKDLPGLPQNFGLKQFAGHIPMDEADGDDIFFWLVQHHHNLDTEKLVIWINGGPGCSSMDGMFLENGPFSVLKDRTLTMNEYSWHHQANMLYVDQPVGTGFSFATNYRDTLPKITDHFILFLEKFFKIFPQFSDDDLYLAGESFAGQYAPYFATEILKRKKLDPDFKMNLQGIAIGNGWIDQQTQYEAYVDFAETHKLGTSETMARARAATQKCSQTYAPPGANARTRYTTCEKILGTLLDGSRTELQCINMYDIRLADKTCGMLWPPKLADTTAYLMRPDVAEAVHATKRKVPWKECTQEVQDALLADESPSSITLLPGLLSEIQVTIFVGDQDLICNTLGIDRMISKLSWNGGIGFGNDDEERERLWKVASPSDSDATFAKMEASGKYRIARNLTYVLIHDASHMVPVDKPREAMDMFHRFIGIGGNVQVKSWVEGIDPRLYSANDQDYEFRTEIAFYIACSVAILCAIVVFTAARSGVPSWMPPVVQNIFFRRGRHEVPTRESDADFRQYDLENFSINEYPVYPESTVGRSNG